MAQGNVKSRGSGREASLAMLVPSSDRTADSSSAQSVLGELLAAWLVPKKEK